MIIGTIANTKLLAAETPRKSSIWPPSGHIFISKLCGEFARKNGGRMALSLRDVRCDPIANRALNELMHHYTVAQEKSRLVLTKKDRGTRLIASIKESRPPPARRRDQPRRPDRAIRRSARPCNDAHAARAEILLEHHAFSRQLVPFRLTQSRISVPSPQRRPGVQVRPSVRFS
jgi:hypothetical protein